MESHPPGSEVRVGHNFDAHLLRVRFLRLISVVVLTPRECRLNAPMRELLCYLFSSAN